MDTHYSLGMMKNYLIKAVSQKEKHCPTTIYLKTMVSNKSPKFYFHYFCRASNVVYYYHYHSKSVNYLWVPTSHSSKTGSRARSTLRKVNDARRCAEPHALQALLWVLIRLNTWYGFFLMMKRYFLRNIYFGLHDLMTPFISTNLRDCNRYS